MEETGKLKLKKPGASDNADIAVLNGNWDKLDKAVSGLDTGKADLDPVTRKIKGEQLPEMDYEPSGAVDTVRAVLETQIAAEATARGAADKLLAPLASPTFTDTPKAPTAAAGNNTAQVATTAFVAQAAQALKGAPPATLDTLAKLAAAIDNDPAFAETLNDALDGKAASAHSHAAGDITSGVLGLARGGTNAATADQGRKNLGAAKNYLLTCTVPTTGWAASGGVSTITISVPGMTADMYPTIIPQYSVDAAAAKLQFEAVGKLAFGTFETLAGQAKLTVYGETPGVQVTLKLEGTVS